METVSDPHEREEASPLLVWALARKGDFDRAEELSHCLPSWINADRAISELAVSLTASGYYDRAEGLALGAADSSPRVEVLAALGSALAAAGEFERALRIIRLIPDEYVAVQGLVDVFVSVANSGNTLQAQQLGDEVEQFARSIDDLDYCDWKPLTYISQPLRLMVAAYARVGDLERAEKLVVTFGDSVVQASGLTALIFWAETAGRRDRVARLAENAERLARTIDDVAERARILAELASALARIEGQDGNSERLAHESEALARGIVDVRQRAHAIRELVGALARAGEYDRGQQLAQTIVDPKLHAQALIRLAVELAHHGQPERAILFAHEADRAGEGTHHGWSPDETVTSVVAALAEHGDVDEAERLARKIDIQYVQEKALGALIGGLRIPAELPRAERIARSVDDSRSQIKLLANLAVSLARGGHNDKARELIDEVTRRAETLPTAYGDERMTIDVATALAEIGEHDRAENVAKAIDSSFERKRAISALIFVHSRAKRYERAEHLVHELADHPYIIRSFAGMAIEAAREGDSDRAEHLAREAQRYASELAELDDEAAAMPYAVVAVAEIGDYESAESMARSIFMPESQLQTLALLVGVVARAGELNRAEKLARSIADPSSQARALIDCAFAVLQNGDRDRARVLVATALSIADWTSLPLSWFSGAAPNVLTVLADSALAADEAA